LPSERPHAQHGEPSTSGISSSLRGEQLDLMRREVELGDTGKAQDLARLEVAAKYLDVHERTLKTLRDQNVSAGQAALATKLDAQARALAEKELARISKAATIGSSPISFGFEDAGVLTGVEGRFGGGSPIRGGGLDELISKLPGGVDEATKNSGKLVDLFEKALTALGDVKTAIMNIPQPNVAAQDGFRWP
jgi:hypothetical protein